MLLSSVLSQRDLASSSPWSPPLLANSSSYLEPTLSLAHTSESPQLDSCYCILQLLFVAWVFCFHSFWWQPRVRRQQWVVWCTVPRGDFNRRRDRCRSEPKTQSYLSVSTYYLTKHTIWLEWERVRIWFWEWIVRNWKEMYVPLGAIWLTLLTIPLGMFSSDHVFTF